jgi:hypothetical protein
VRRPWTVEARWYRGMSPSLRDKRRRALLMQWMVSATAIAD